MEHRVQKSMLDLIEQLGVACGAEKDHLHTELGHTISHSVTSYTSNPDRARGKLGLPVVGGAVAIKFDGPQQPEAARLLDSVLSVVIEKSKMPEPMEPNPAKPGEMKRVSRRFGTDDFAGTGRVIRFAVPDEYAAVFSDEADRIVRMLKRSGELKRQAHAAVEFSLKTVNQIPGAKPHVKITLPDGEGEKEKPYFRLHIEGVPDMLASKLAEVMHEDEGGFRASEERRGRDLKGSHTGGKTVDIPMNADFTAEALETIKGYVSIQGRLHDGGRELPSGKKPPSRALPGAGSRA